MVTMAANASGGLVVTCPGCGHAWASRASRQTRCPSCGGQIYFGAQLRRELAAGLEPTVAPIYYPPDEDARVAPWAARRMPVDLAGPTPAGMSLPRTMGGRQQVEAVATIGDPLEDEEGDDLYDEAAEDDEGDDLDDEGDEVEEGAEDEGDDLYNDDEDPSPSLPPAAVIVAEGLRAAMSTATLAPPYVPPVPTYRSPVPARLPVAVGAARAVPDYAAPSPGGRRVLRFAVMTGRLSCGHRTPLGGQPQHWLGLATSCPRGCGDATVLGFD